MDENEIGGRCCSCNCFALRCFGCWLFKTGHICTDAHMLVHLQPIP
jgi:hypothetical protein